MLRFGSLLRIRDAQVLARPPLPRLFGRSYGLVSASDAEAANLRSTETQAAAKAKEFRKRVGNLTKKAEIHRDKKKARHMPVSLCASRRLFVRARVEAGATQPLRAFSLLTDEQAAEIETIEYLPQDSKVYRDWLRGQQLELYWDRWAMMFLIGMVVGICAYCLHEFFHGLAEWKVRAFLMVCVQCDGELPRKGPQQGRISPAYAVLTPGRGRAD